ncbi:succinate dehydrogenase assembly factor 2 [uncultured Maritimibacter sp.]|jgi:antitoxin CptB|uniref:FAD assembly factor SdhE n=1 Tax=uncultured Maritimibacter sp. TaxID=991866 RepID=UPI000AEF4BBE|nr:succinate dehydrogenase assembly factor 2 [uncultured Maritimibacter sp.]
METEDARLKRMTMRSWRRGTKEMDIILGRFCDDRLAGLGRDDLDLYDELLSENDQDLYQWVTGQVPAPARFAGLIAVIADHAGGRG